MSDLTIQALVPLSDGRSSYISVPDPSAFACHIFLTVYIRSLFGWLATAAVKLVQTRAPSLSYTKVPPGFPVIAHSPISLRTAPAPSLRSIFLFSWRLLLFFFFFAFPLFFLSKVSWCLRSSDSESALWLETT